MKRSAPASSAILVELKRGLRQAGWTARRIAEEFAIGEATAKRWLAGRGLTLDRLEHLAALSGRSLGELAREAEQPHSGLAQELTLAQERALSSEVFLSFLFMNVLGGAPVDEIARDFDIPAAVMEAGLAKLERLALIDRRPGGRVRARVERAVIWRKSPMRNLFEERMKPQFMEMDFGDESAVYTAEMVKLSAQGAAMLAELIEQHRRAVQALADRDREESLLPQSWYAMLCAMREIDTAQIRNDIRAGA